MGKNRTCKLLSTPELKIIKTQNWYRRWFYFDLSYIKKWNWSIIISLSKFFIKDSSNVNTKMVAELNAVSIHTNKTTRSQRSHSLTERCTIHAEETSKPGRSHDDLSLSMDEDTLPPPQLYPCGLPRREICKSSSAVTTPCGSTILSPTSLTFQCVSSNFCELLQFESKEICGRSVRCLQGPRTDSREMLDAIRDTAMFMRTTFRTVMYKRNGQSCTVLATCSPLVSSEGKVVGCVLDVQPMRRSCNWKALKGNGVLDQGSIQERNLVQRYRMRYNFSTGLSMLRQ